MKIDRIKAALRGDPDAAAACTPSKCKKPMFEAQEVIAQLQKEVERLTIERKHMLNAIRRLDLDCDACWHNHGDDCENPDFDCMTCECDCICKSCRNNSNWEWRGAKANNQGGKP